MKSLADAWRGNLLMIQLFAPIRSVPVRAAGAELSLAAGLALPTALAAGAVLTAGAGVELAPLQAATTAAASTAARETRQDRMISSSQQFR
jgi:hypothetical protein